MIVGAHSIIYSTSPEADRAFFRDVLGLPNVDVGDGWLIFGLPPAEVAVHPSNENDVHEFYLMCEDVEALIKKLSARGIACEPAQNLGWGVLTQVRLPGGGRLGVYEPRHARPRSVSGTVVAQVPARSTSKAAGVPARRRPKPKTRPRSKAKARSKSRPKGKARRR